MKLVAWAKLFLYGPNECGVPYAFKGRLVGPSVFPNDQKTSWIMIIMFDQMTAPGTHFDGPVTLLSDDKINELLVVGNEFEFYLESRRGGTGEIISVKEVTDAEVREIFKIDVWPGTTHIIWESTEE